MRLIVKDKVLDLKAGTKLSFQKSNPLFAFDDLKCERTQSFDIPSTPRNDAVFGIVNPAWDSNTMRRRFDAQLQDGLVVKDGYLYVDSYSNRTYKAVFVTGEMVGLQRINSAGKIAEVASERFATVDALPLDASSPDVSSLLFGRVKYMQEKYPSVQSPSTGVGELMQNIASNLGTTINVPQDVYRWRIVPPEIGKMGEESNTFGGTSMSRFPSASVPPAYLNSRVYDNNSLIESAVLNVTAYDEVSGGYGWQTDRDWHYKIGVFNNRQAVSLSFPSDFPSNVFLIRIVNTDIKTSEDVEFLGDWSFSKDAKIDDTYDKETGECVTTENGVVTDGEPLAGRTIDVPFDSYFLFVTPIAYVHTFDREGVATQRRRVGWCFNILDYEYSIKTEGADADEEHIVTSGEWVRMSDNLPDMKVADLLKIIAGVSGKVLNYTDADGITFDALDFDTWARKVLDGSLVKMSEIKQVFGDYARRNVITYTQDENTMKESEVLSAEYEVDNDNLEAVKTLLEVKLANASARVLADGTTTATINNQYEDAEQYFLLRGTPADEVRTETERIFLQRLPITLNAGLRGLCERSVSVKAVFRMSLLEFERIKAKTVIVLRGVEYVWTEATWSKDEATFSLSALPIA